MLGDTFSQRVVNRRNSLDQETVDVSSINSFKGKLDKIRKTRMGFLWILHGLQSPRPHEMGPREATQGELQGEYITERNIRR